MLKVKLSDIPGKDIIFHGQHEDLSGESLECYNCHNYIKYTLGSPDQVWKDEIYLPDDYLLIREFKEDKSIFIIAEKQVAILPGIIQFSDADQLLNKLKTIVVFS